MKNKNKYLIIGFKSLLIRYGAIYVALAMAILFSKHSLLLFTAAYWCICGSLMLLEGLGSYVTMTDEDLTWRSWTFSKLSIPLKNITSLEVGEFYGVGHPKCVIMNFTLRDGRQSKGYLTTQLYSEREIFDFVHQLKQKAPHVIIDKEVEKTLRKK
jgi:hypothetical protein